MLLYLAQETAFALIPGALLYAALSPRPVPALEQAAVGYALGSVLEVLAFALTAALGIRAGLWAYPVVVSLAAYAVARRRRVRLVPGLGGRRSADALALAGVSIGAIVYLVVAYFLFNPLPSQAGSVVYLPDLVFHLGIAAEALHHWPITDPKVSGIALPYETFLYMKLAAISQTAHIALPTILFRLYILPVVVAIAAGLTCLGEVATGRRSVGVLGAALFLFVGQLGLDSHDQLVFYNTVFFSLWDSPTYAFGLVVFLGTMVVLVRLLTDPAPGMGGWVLLAVMLIGCAGAKASILPVLVGGLALFLAFQWLGGRDRRRAAIALVTAAAVFAITYVIIYSGESGGLKLNPPGSIRAMDFIGYVQAQLGVAHGNVLFWLGATVVGLIGFGAATLAGLPAALWSRGVRSRPASMLLLAIAIVSFVPFLLYTHKGGSENFFTYYGICGATILSAQGLWIIWQRARPLVDSRRARRLVAVAAAWVAGLLVAAVLPYALASKPSMGPLYALWIGLPLIVVTVIWIAWRRLPDRRRLLELCAAGAVIAVGFLDTPLHTAASIWPRLRAGKPIYQRDSPDYRGLTPGLQAALRWVRDHTPTSAVLAVNNQYSDGRRQDPTYYYYSAFGERRVFLEGWVDTIPDAGYNDPELTPFPRRYLLNIAVFGDADRAALETMRRRYDVDYLFVDRIHGPVDPGLARLGTRVFENASAIIYRVG